MSVSSVEHSQDDSDHTGLQGSVLPSITLKRRGQSAIVAEPERVLIDAGMFGVPASEQTGRFSLLPAPGWQATPVGKLAWEIVPYEVDVDRLHTVEIRREIGDRVHSWRLDIPVRLDLSSTLDPVEHTFPEPNRASVLGDILPERTVFERTYAMPGGFMSDALFRGLYTDIVFLRREGPTRGGLCSGMARWAIARSRGDEPAPASRNDALRRITMYHGRQLTDMSFLMGIPSFLRGSPRSSYRTVRRDLLRTGSTQRAFDVGVPKPWRRDVVTALVSKGHTIVPYRIIQYGPERATVEVYDPNRPPATLETPEVVEFDLCRDRYSYRHMVSMDQSDVGLVVARQHGYARRGTAFAAGIVSAIMTRLDSRAQ